MPPKTVIPRYAEPPYTIDSVGLTDDEKAEMTARVLRHVRLIMKDIGSFNAPANWSALADELAIACDLADNKRYAQRSSWTIIVCKAGAFHVTYSKRFTLEFVGKHSWERLSIYMFYE